MTANVQGAWKVSAVLEVGTSKGKDTGLVSGFQTLMSQTGGFQTNSMKTQDLQKISDRVSSVKAISKNKVTATKTAAQSMKSGKKTDIDDNALLQNAVTQAGEELKETVKEALGISDDEFSALLQNLGMTLMDLFQPENLLQLVMTQTGEQTPVQILGNEALAQTVKELMQTMQTIKENFSNENAVTVSEAVELLQNIKQPEAEVAEESTVDSVSPKSSETGLSAEESVGAIKVEISKENTTDFSEGSDKQEESGQASLQEIADKNPKTMSAGENVVANLTQAVSNSSQISYGSQAQAVDIVNQIVEQIKTEVKADTTKMEIQLNPENLGKVNITVASREGLITAQIAAQTDAAKNAIESQIMILKETFQNQGLKVEAVEVSVSPQGFDTNQQEGFQNQNQQDTKQRRNLRVRDLMDERKDLSEEEAIAVEMMQREGNQIDYSA